MKICILCSRGGKSSSELGTCSQDGKHQSFGGSLFILPWRLVLNNSKEQSPSWEQITSSATQEIRSVLWNPKVHYRIHKSLPIVHVVSEKNSIHAAQSHFSMTRFNIIIPSTLWSLKLLLSIRFLDQCPVYISSLPHTCHVPRPYLSSRLVRSADHKVRPYVVFSILLIPWTAQAQISFPAPYSRKISVYIPPSI